MLTPTDRIIMLDVLFGVRLAVAGDGYHLEVTGPESIVEAATPMLRRYRRELVECLRRSC